MRKKYRPSTITYIETSAMNSMVKLWIMRILVPLGGMKELIDYGYSDGDLVQALGLSDTTLMDRNEGLDFDAAQARRNIISLYKKPLRESKSASLPATLLGNVESIARLAALTPVDCRIFEFTLMLNVNIYLQKKHA